jgi:hypothetical protein
VAWLNKRMKMINTLVVAIIALLSIAAGLAKVMQTPQEMAFLQGLGMSTGLIVAFGLVQIIGGVLLVLKKTRMPGVVLATSAFVVSTVLIFIGGDFTFGLISILPIALAGLIINQLRKTR